MKTTFIKLSNIEHREIVNSFAETMQMPLTKAVVLAVMLANKYQQTELENKALRQALASAQSTTEGFTSDILTKLASARVIKKQPINQ